MSVLHLLIKKRKKKVLPRFEPGTLVCELRELTIRPRTFLRNTDAVKLISTGFPQVLEF